MKFIDELYITVKSGNGGSGRVSFMHSHLNPLSGPDGGNGGKGGSVYFRGDRQLNSFFKLSAKKRRIAESGVNGGECLRTGKTGENLYIDVPLGTIVCILNDKKENEFLGEILYDKQEVLVSKGGKGGLGNAAFASSVNRTPRYAQSGEVTKELKIFLELKIIADIGFLGLPNSGKSTLLNALTNSNVESANFEFTTLNPQLGVLNDSKLKTKTVIADLPGIIEGASENKGLGFKFLKHISHCKILVYVIDSSKDDPFADFDLLQNELRKSKMFNFDSKKFLIIWNKIDLLSSRKMNEIKAKAQKMQNIISFFVSALKNENLNEVIDVIDNIVENSEDVLMSAVDSEIKTYKVYDFTSDLIDIVVRKLKPSYWKITGSYIDKIIEESSSEDLSESISKALDNKLAKDKILQAGVKNGDTLLIDDNEYLWA
ncbi:MAG: GTPase Obg [Mycoplasmataceae bacterium]|nr:MAG: GTPase Obg [Mycoplasmataceae bacterium]